MSEPLRTDQGIDEIAEHAECDDGGKDIIPAHLKLLADKRIGDGRAEKGQAAHHEYDIQHNASNSGQASEGDAELTMLETADASALSPIKWTGVFLGAEYREKGL